MTYLGLQSTVPIDITEIGYPVSSPADYTTQADYWSRVLDTIYAYRADAGIRSVYVFRFPPTVSAAAADYGIVKLRRDCPAQLRRDQSQHHQGRPGDTPPIGTRAPGRTADPTGHNHSGHARPERPNGRLADRIRRRPEDPQFPRAAGAHLSDRVAPPPRPDPGPRRHRQPSPGEDIHATISANPAAARN